MPRPEKLSPTVMMAKPAIPIERPRRREIPDIASPMPERQPIPTPVPQPEPVKTPLVPVPVGG